MILWYLNLPLFQIKDLMATITEFASENYWATIMIISNDNDSLIFDMHIMMKMIPRYYHSIITQISIKYPNIKSQTNNILSRYFDKPQYCTLVLLWHLLWSNHCQIAQWTDTCIFTPIWQCHHTIVGLSTWSRLTEMDRLPRWNWFLFIWRL